MAEIDYPACIRELYESEIFGEALTLALVAVSKSDRERYHNGTLLQLETETEGPPKTPPIQIRHQSIGGNGFGGRTPTGGKL